MRDGGKPAGSCLPSVQPTRLAARSGRPVPSRLSVRGISGDSSPPSPHRVSHTPSSPLFLFFLPHRIAAPSLPRRRRRRRRCRFYRASGSSPHRKRYLAFHPAPLSVSFLPRMPPPYILLSHIIEIYGHVCVLVSFSRGSSSSSSPDSVLTLPPARSRSLVCADTLRFVFARGCLPPRRQGSIVSL